MRGKKAVILHHAIVPDVNAVPYCDIITDADHVLQRAVFEDTGVLADFNIMPDERIAADVGDARVTGIFNCLVKPSPGAVQLCPRCRYE